MILGIGIDLTDVARIRASIARHGDRFLERFLVEGELAYCRSHADPALPAAARRAAKEAVAKAIGNGFGKELAWREIEIVREASGAPAILLHGAARDLMARRGGSRLHVTLTHEKTHAAAFVVIEGE
jgi:holo-[acyl-carrier protein] synthase